MIVEGRVRRYRDWRYEDPNDQMEPRRRMLAGPCWQTYLNRITDPIDIQQTRMLVLTTFSAIR